MKLATSEQVQETKQEIMYFTCTHRCITNHWLQHGHTPLFIMTHTSLKALHLPHMLGFGLYVSQQLLSVWLLAASQWKLTDLSIGMSYRHVLKQPPSQMHLSDRIFQHPHLCQKNIIFSGHLEQRVMTGAKSGINCKQFLSWHTFSEPNYCLSDTDTLSVCGRHKRYIFITSVLKNNAREWLVYSPGGNGGGWPWKHSIMAHFIPDGMPKLWLPNSIHPPAQLLS